MKIIHQSIGGFAEPSAPQLHEGYLLCVYNVTACSIPRETRGVQGIPPHAEERRTAHGRINFPGRGILKKNATWFLKR